MACMTTPSEGSINNGTHVETAGRVAMNVYIKLGNAQTHTETIQMTHLASPVMELRCVVSSVYPGLFPGEYLALASIYVVLPARKLQMPAISSMRVPWQYATLPAAKGRPTL